MFDNCEDRCPKLLKTTNPIVQELFRPKAIDYRRCFRWISLSNFARSITKSIYWIY